MKIFNVFDDMKHLMASFTDHDKCKEWLKTYEGWYVPAWVGVFPADETAKAIPMWRPQEFIDGFPHSK